MIRTKLLILKEYIRGYIKKSILTERYIQKVANKAANGEKFDQDDIEGLFSMITSWNINKNPSAAEASAAAWTNLVSGLESEKDKEYASKAYQISIELAKLEKLKKSLENSNISVMSREYDELEDKLNDITDKRISLEDKMQSLTYYLGKVHKSPKSKYKEEEIKPRKDLSGRVINPTDPSREEKTKH